MLMRSKTVTTRQNKPSNRRHWVRLLALSLATGLGLSACSSEFQAVSVNPRRAWDDSQRLLFLYGSGFEQGVTATVSYIDQEGQPQNASIANVQVLDGYTLAGYLPNLADQVKAEIFPYKEFVGYSGSVTPGLYDCSSGEPILYTPGSTLTYCNALGQSLSYAPFDDTQPNVPPANGESALRYADWYDLLHTCTYYLSGESSITDEQLALLIPDYGLGCFFTESEGQRTYEYCPLYIPNSEVDVIVQQNGESRTLSRALSLRNHAYDYYYDERYGQRVQGGFGILGELTVGIEEGFGTQGDVNQVTFGDGSSVGLVATFNTVDQTVSLLSDVYGGTLGEATAYRFLEGAPSSVRLGQLNGDTVPDLLVTVPDDGAAFIMYTSAQDPSTASPLSFAGEPSRLPLIDFKPQLSAIGDVNGDGNTDIVLAGVRVSNASTGRIAILLRDADTGLSTPTYRDIGGPPAQLVLGSLNADFGLDIVLLDANTPALTRVLSRKEPTSGALEFVVQTSNLSTSSEPLGLGVAQVGFDDGSLRHQLMDTTGDEKTDVVLLERDGTERHVLVFAGNGAGELSNPVPTVLPIAAEAIGLVQTDADGLIDLVAASPEGRLALLKGSSSTRFNFVTTLYGASDVGQLFSLDLDLDGDEDLLTLSPLSASLALYNNPSTLWEYFESTLGYCTY